MNLSEFTTTARLMVAANDAAREAHIAALVARAEWSAFEADVSGVNGKMAA